MIISSLGLPSAIVGMLVLENGSEGVPSLSRLRPCLWLFEYLASSKYFLIGFITTPWHPCTLVTGGGIFFSRRVDCDVSSTTRMSFDDRNSCRPANTLEAAEEDSR